MHDYSCYYKRSIFSDGKKVVIDGTGETAKQKSSKGGLEFMLFQLGLLGLKWLLS